MSRDASNVFRAPRRSCDDEGRNEYGIFMNTCAIITTDWGKAAIVVSKQGLCGLRLPEPSLRAVESWLRSEWPQAQRDDSICAALRKQIQAYFAGRTVRFDVKLDLDAVTPFRRCVLKACAGIPYGDRTSYGELARAVGRPRASRAVGGAMACNPIPLVIP